MHLGELLLARGLVTNSDVESAVERQEKLGGRIGENLIALGAITRKTLDAALREQYELAKAILAAEDLLTKSKRINGDAHPKTNRVRCLLAVALTTGGRAAEALGVARTALTGHQEALGADHPWTKDSAQAVADALAAIESAASPGEGPAVAARVGAGEQHVAPHVVFGAADDLDAARSIKVANGVDRVAAVGEVTTRFVGKAPLHGQHVGPVMRVIGVLSRRH
jgi:hypothetical protein